MTSKKAIVIVAASLVAASVQGGAIGAPETCFGQRGTITGGGRGETLEGTPGNDVIIGRGGDDIIRGLGGDDLICGGPGADRIAGGAGNDKLSGGAGAGEDDAVTFRKAPAGVRVDLGAGTATGQGNDRIQGFEIVVGSPNRDVLTGDPQAPYEDLHGKRGADVLKARSRQSTLFGERGNDDLTGGPGDDDFFPGRGDDLIDGSGGGAKGTDVLLFWFSPRAVRVEVRTGQARGEGADNFRYIDIYFGSHFGDTLLGSRDPDSFNGDQGNDLIRGRAGNDRLLGDVGDDRIFGGTGNDHLDGQWERDELDGGDGTDECLNGERLRACE